MSDFVTISDPPANLLRQASLFLDLDGTVLELADSPHGVRVGPDLVDLLELAQQKLSGRLAVISGRSAVDVAGLFPSLNLNIAGSHGLEIRWADGRRNAPVRGPAVDEALATMQRFADPRQGLLVEDKPFGVALHYRLAPQLERECQALAEQLARDTGLILQTGKMVAELKTSAAHKGDALDLFRFGVKQANVYRSQRQTGASVLIADRDIAVCVPIDPETNQVFALAVRAYHIDQNDGSCHPLIVRTATHHVGRDPEIVAPVRTNFRHRRPRRCLKFLEKRLSHRVGRYLTRVQFTCHRVTPSDTPRRLSAKVRE